MMRTDMRRAAAPISAILLLLAAYFAGPAAAESGDRVACYKVKDRARPRTSSVSVGSTSGVQTCQVTVPARLACAGVEAGGAGGAFLCYPLRCPRPVPPGASMTDALGGTRVVTFKRAQLLCEPATRNPTGPSTTSTTVGSTTTTTVTAGACDFDDHSRTCKGTCGGGAHCSAVASGGACECRTTACGDADSPSCDGYCAPDEACVFLLTGCSCVSIP